VRGLIEQLLYQGLLLASLEDVDNTLSIAPERELIYSLDHYTNSQKDQ